MGWPEIIQKAYAVAGGECYPRFRPPAQIATIESAEHDLGAEFPAELMEILLSADGVEEVLTHTAGDVVIGWLIWPVSQIVEENRRLRTETPENGNEGAIHDVLFFANAGVDGILFGYDPATATEGRSKAIVVWKPLSTTLTAVGYDLEVFLKRWLTGDLQL
jgi:hypothetical protein